jgi:DNA-binding MurR/RpiR family transcriptional regulator
VRISLDTDAVAELVEKIGQARRIVILPEAPAQPAAYNLVYFLEQGGFSVFIARPGVADLARTVHTATQNDLLLAVDVAGQMPYIARTLAEAQSKGVPTGAIVGAASIASARAADVVLEAQANPSVGVSIISVEAVVYALTQSLRWRFADRFAGAEQAIQELSNRIQQPNEQDKKST